MIYNIYSKLFGTIDLSNSGFLKKKLNPGNLLASLNVYII